MRMAKTYTGKREFIALQASFHDRSYATLSITGNLARKKERGLICQESASLHLLTAIDVLLT